MSIVKENVVPLTVVIPTLGGDCLRATIDALNRGSAVPQEILVCIPADFAQRVKPEWPNVSVVATECKGQVAQRAVGFGRAATPLVMQLDDDLLVDRDCVRYLLEAIASRGSSAAVAPSLIDRETGESIYKRPQRGRVAETIYALLTNGTTHIEQGKVLRSGGAVGLDPSSVVRDVYRVEWVPGGCVMHHKANLVLDDYFPFRGKAYCEDIIHSYHLTSHGVQLYVEPRALCSVEAAPDADLTLREYLRSVRADLHPRRHYMRLTGRSPFRLAFFVAGRFVNYAAGRLGRRNAEAHRN